MSNQHPLPELLERIHQNQIGAKAAEQSGLTETGDDVRPSCGWSASLTMLRKPMPAKVTSHENIREDHFSYEQLKLTPLKLESGEHGQLDKIIHI